MEAKVRAFLALQLPEEAVHAAGGVTRQLRAALGDDDVKWVPPENLHMTLRFFGGLTAEEVARAALQVRGYPPRIRAVSTAWGRVGAFPSERRPQVIWLGFLRRAEAIVELAREVNRALERDGFGRADKPFRPHVTLGRVRRGRCIRWPLSDDLTISQAAFSIDSIALIESRLTPRGPVYTPIETAHLQE